MQPLALACGQGAGRLSQAQVRKSHIVQQLQAGGDLLLGMKKPVQLLNRNSEIHQIVDLAAIASVDAYKASRGMNNMPELIENEGRKRPRNIVEAL